MVDVGVSAAAEESGEEDVVGADGGAAIGVRVLAHALIDADGGGELSCFGEEVDDGVGERFGRGREEGQCEGRDRGEFGVETGSAEAAEGGEEGGGGGAGARGGEGGCPGEEVRAQTWVGERGDRGGEIVGGEAGGEGGDGGVEIGGGRRRRCAEALQFLADTTRRTRAGEEAEISSGGGRAEASGGQ